MSRKKWACGLAAATLTTLGLVATALATGNKLHATGPIAVAASTPTHTQTYTIKTTGYADQTVGKPNPADQVVAWSTKKMCKLADNVPSGTSPYTAELALQGSRAPKLDASVKDSFSKTKTLTAPQSSKLPASGQETLYWCAYLINSSTEHTYKAGYLHYQILGGGGPGGPGGP